MLKVIQVFHSDNCETNTVLRNHVTLLKQGLIPISIFKVVKIDFIKRIKSISNLDYIFIKNNALLTNEFSKYLRSNDKNDNLVYGDSIVKDEVDWYESRPDWSPNLFRETEYIGDVYAMLNTYYRVEKLSRFNELLDLTLNINDSRGPNIRKLDFAVSTRVSTQNSDFAIPILYDENNSKKLTNIIRDYDLVEDKCLSVVIPTIYKTFEGEPMLNRCIENLRKEFKNYLSKIIIVCNKNVISNNFKLTESLKESEDILIVETSGEFNFSNSINTGAIKCDSKYLLILNDDVFIENRSTAKHILSHLLDENTGAVGSILVYPSGDIQHAGIVFRSERPENMFRGSPKEKFEHLLNSCREVSGVTGAFILLRKSTFDLVGGMDEKYPLNFGDVEFMMRIRQYGKSIILCSKFLGLHLESQSQDDINHDLVNLEFERFRKHVGYLPTRDPYIYSAAIRRNH